MSEEKKDLIKKFKKKYPKIRGKVIEASYFYMMSLDKKYYTQRRVSKMFGVCMQSISVNYRKMMRVKK